uniref:Nematode cuticle collagen N-terminal domain-containing protein n=1 Tax=Panagrolaimus sp. ES5 TaxID=591445 RepID=A0AC34FUP8_9BILA
MKTNFFFHCYRQSINGCGMSSYDRMDDSGVKNRQAEAEGLRTIAFFGVALSTIATLVCVLSVPMLYNYMQHMQSVMQNEVDFCKSRSGNIWREVTRTQVLGKVNPRVARQAGYGESSGVEGGVASGSAGGSGGGCCGCGVSEAGPPGPPGPDGSDGEDGAPGEAGNNGQDGPAATPQPQVDWCFECADAPAGAPGNAGPKGAPGNAGAPGAPADGGQRGPAGPAGKIIIKSHFSHLNIQMFKVLLVHPDKLVQTEMLVPLVNPVLLMMFPAQKAQLVHQVQMVNPDLQDHPAQMDNPDKLEVKVLPVMLDPMVPQVTQVPMEKMALMVKLVPVVNAHTVLLLVLPQVIKPAVLNYHLWEADLLLKAWLPLVESKNSFPFFPSLLFILWLSSAFGDTKNRLDLGSHASS